MSDTKSLMRLFARRISGVVTHATHSLRRARRDPGGRHSQGTARVRRPRSRTSVMGIAVAALCLAAAHQAFAKEESHGKRKWIATWAASAHGSYPVGTAIAQPILTFAFPSPQIGADDQTFRLILRPDLWGDTFRLRFSNAFGTQPVTIDGAYVGLQANSAAVVPGSNRPVTFSGNGRVTIPAGELAYTDPVKLEYLEDPDRFFLDGRKLAVSFHIVGQTGPMTWHSKALQTSYVTAPGAGSVGGVESDRNFPYSTASWYFLDAVEVMGSADTVVVVALGDSITDGTGSTLNGDDRWPDVLSRRLHAAYGNRVSVVNAGIGGNRVVTPESVSPFAPVAGGPSALSRLERDVFSLGGASAIVWLEGINDLGGAGATAEEVIAGLAQGAQRARARGMKVIAATITSSFTSTIASYATSEVNARRQAINAFIRTSPLFDSVADFDAATIDSATGVLRSEFQPNSTTAVIDRLHPNRAGYQAMANAIDITVLAPVARGRSGRR
jgi:lysophospholipase L1-like esterase